MEVPPIRQLNPLENAHNRYVAERKGEQEEFKALLKQWNEGTVRATDTRPNEP